MPKSSYESTPVATRVNKESGEITYTTPIGKAKQKIGTKDWFTWLESTGNTTFYVDSSPFEYTARRELRRNKYFWYAYKKYNDVLYKVYMGRSAMLTYEYVFRTIPLKMDRKING